MSADSTTRIFLVRPGATDLDEQGRITGTLDVPLSQLGRRQIQQLAVQTTEFDLQAVYSSPSVAARDTAKAIALSRKIRVRVVEQLRNVDHGLWQGKEIEELRATQPKIARQWEDHPETVCPPGGEPIEMVLPRINQLLKKIRKKHKSASVAIVVADPLARLVANILLDGEQSTQPNNTTLLMRCGTLETLQLDDSHLSKAKLAQASGS